MVSMAKAKGSGSRISGRTAIKLAAVAAIFVLGAGAGGGCSARSGGIDKDTVVGCLPIHDAAQLDACLGGGQ